MWVSPILDLVGWDVQESHATYQCYEEFPMRGNQTVCNFGGKYFSWASGSFKYGWVVYNEDGRTSWCLDPFITDTVKPYFYIFLILSPHVIFLTHPESTRQKYRRLCKSVVTLKCIFQITNHNMKTINSRQKWWKISTYS